MKYVARVRDVLVPGIHTTAVVERGEIQGSRSMPLPDRVEIETFGDGSDCFLYRYTRSGECCGDTWHETLQAAFEQAQFEYGLAPDHFLAVHGEQ